MKKVAFLGIVAVACVAAPPALWGQGSVTNMAVMVMPLTNMTFDLEPSIVLEDPVVSNANVALRWSRSSHPGFAAYLLFRSTGTPVRTDATCVEEFLSPLALSFVDTVATPGAYFYRVFEKVYASDVDAFLYLGSNEKSAVVTNVPLPDFCVTAIALDPENPNTGEVFSAFITVTNQGSARGGYAYLDVWWDRPGEVFCGTSGDLQVAVGFLDPGMARTVTATGLAASAAPGTNIFRAFVDSFCVMDESSEANNQCTRSYVVGSP